MTSLLKCILAIAVMALLATNVGAADPKRIVILHSYSQNSNPWSKYSKAFRQELEQRSRWPIVVQEFSVVATSDLWDNSELRFAQYLSALFTHNVPDLIVAFGAPAATFVQSHRSQLLPVVPMLLTAVDVRRLRTIAFTENDAIVATRIDIPKLFENILQVRPKTKTVAIVIGNSPNERFWIEEMRKELEPLKDRLQLLFFNEIPVREILRRASSLPSDSAIFWVQPQLDATGAMHEGEQTLKMLHAVANAPIFSHDDAYFSGEIVGGPMTSVSVGAEVASKVAVRILDGEKPGTLVTPPLEYGPAKFDWRQLQRWKIDESRLPPGSEVYFREPRIWEKYRWQVSLVGIIVAIQTMLITALLYEVRRRRLAEVQARQRMSELAHMNRYSMAGELSASVAHELGQPLGAILANAESAELMLAESVPNMEEIRQIVADIRRDDERATQVIVRLRSLLKKAPFERQGIELNGLVRETIDLISSLAQTRKVDISFSANPISLPMNGDRVQIQQVLLNVLVNAIEAMANNPDGERAVTIWTERGENYAVIWVSDVGAGIPPDRLKEVFEPFFSTKSNGMGMGLPIARTIVEAHHGDISAESRANGGAVFRIQLPLEQAPRSWFDQ